MQMRRRARIESALCFKTVRDIPDLVHDLLGSQKGDLMSFTTETEQPMSEARRSTVTVLVVDDEDAARGLCSDVATESGLRVRTASTTEQAQEILDQFPVDIVITDLKVPQMGGLELLKRIRATLPQVSVMVLTQYGTIESAVEATRLGAAD